MLCSLKTDYLAWIVIAGVSKSKTLSPASFTSDGRYIISVRDNLRVHIWNSNPFIDIPLSKKPKLIRSCETFLSENASIAIPWPAVNRAKPDLPNSSDPSSPRCFSLGVRFFPLGPTVTWPEEKLPSNFQCNMLEKLGIFVNCDMGAWSAGILTAGYDGIIRSFHNYGLPVRLWRNIFCISGVRSNLNRIEIWSRNFS